MDTRSPCEDNSVEVTIPRTTQDVHLPQWVNEPLPDLRVILSGRELSRLTRRPRWLLLGLAALGRFPKRRMHCGKPIGWHRADVLDWLTQNMTIEADGTSVPHTCRQHRPSQARLPLELSVPRKAHSLARHRRTTQGANS